MNVSEVWFCLIFDVMILMGIVCVVYGYIGEFSWFVLLIFVYIVKYGFFVCVMDYMGYGYFEGLVVYLLDINIVVDECILFFNKFCVGYVLIFLVFLYVELLGGVIVLLIMFCCDGVCLVSLFDGVVLNGVMCGMSDKFKFLWLFEYFLFMVVVLILIWCVVLICGYLFFVFFKVMFFFNIFYKI